MRASEVRRRLLALEQRRANVPPFMIVRFRSFDSRDDDEIRTLQVGKGTRQWVREADESEEAFIARARREAPPAIPGCTLVLLSFACDDEAA